MIKVSIIVPVYNVEAFLEECLNSLLNQTLKEIEIIVVNDGSTDNSLAIIKEFEKKDSRVKVINQINSGVSNARNRGLDIAQGKYISFIDPDDFITLNMIETMYNKAVETSADIAISGYKKVNRTGEVISIHNPLLQEGVYDEFDIKEKIVRKYIGLTDEEFQSVITGNYNDLIIGYVWVNLYRAELIQRNNLRFNTSLKMHEDDLFNLEAFYLSKKVVSMDSSFYMYRQVQGSAMNGYKEWYVENKIKYYLAKKKYLHLNNDDRFYEECFVNCIFIDLMGMAFNVCRGSNSKSIIKKNQEIKKIYKNELIINSIEKSKKKMPSLCNIKGVNTIFKYIIWKLFVLKCTFPIVVIVSLRMNKK